MTMTQVAEEALRGFVRPDAAVEVGRLAGRGAILVLRSDGATISLAEADAALNAVREDNRTHEA